MSMTISSGAAAGRPHLGPRRRPGRGDVAQPVAVDRLEHPPHRRIRRHRPEQVRLLTQHGDVGQTVTAVGEHHRQLRQHDPRIVRRATPPGVRHRRRQPAVSPTRSASSASNNDPACDATPLPSPVTFTRCAARVPFTFEVPSRSAR